MLHLLCCFLVIEWQLTCKQEEQNNSIRPCVGGKAIWLPTNDFRSPISHVTKYSSSVLFVPDNNCFVKPADAGYRSLEVTVLRNISHQDTLGAKVPQDDTQLMQIFKGLTDLNCQFSYTFFVKNLVLLRASLTFQAVIV